MPVIDFSNVKSARYEPLPEGTYLFQIVDTEFTTSKGGHEMLEVKLVPQGDDFDNRFVIERFTFPHPDEIEAGKVMGLPFLKALLEVLGYELDGEVDMNRVAAQMVDEFVTCRVMIEPDKDDPTVKYNRIRNYSPANPA